MSIDDICAIEGCPATKPRFPLRVVTSEAGSGVPVEIEVWVCEAHHNANVYALFEAAANAR